MSITPQFLDQLRARLNVSEVIGQRIKIQRAGREYKACCPFHNEKTPSFTINDDKQFYHCFGCGAHGDVVGFVMQHDNLSFIEAVEILASKAGMQVPKPSPEEVEKAKKAKSLYELMHEAAQYYARQLFDPKNRNILDYLYQRGLKKETLEKFRVGYAPDNNEPLWDLLLKKGFEREQLLEAGIYRKSSKNNSIFPFMRERVIFPVSDRRGRVVAFGGRVLPDDMRAPSHSGYAPPKYLNSSESALFQKGSLLYGESFARQAAGEGKDLIVVEGYMDVIACHQSGFTGAVAPLGTALTENQISSLWRMIRDAPKEPVICFDGDAAGLKAADRASQRVIPLLQSDQSVRFCFMPQGQDPDSLIKSEGPAAFQKRLKASLSLVDFLWTRSISGRSFETPEARAGLEENLEEQIKQISNKSLQHYYRQVIREKLKNAFGFKPDKKKYQKGRGSQYYEPGGQAKPQIPHTSVTGIREKIILAVLINHPCILRDVEQDIETLSLSDARLDHLRQEIMEYWAQCNEDELDSGKLLNDLKEKGFADELEMILDEDTFIHAGFARADRPFENVLEGWQDIWSLINTQKAANELKSIGKKFIRECSDDAQDHFFHLVRQHTKMAES